MNEHDEALRKQTAFLGQPKGVGTLSFMQLCNSFANYAMSAVLIYYLYANAPEGLGFSKANAAQLISLYSTVVVLTGIVGSFVCDRILGCRKSLFIARSLSFIGYVCLALPLGVPGYGIAMGCLAIGPMFGGRCLDALLGKFYDESDGRRDSAYTISYVISNIGAAAPVLSGAIAAALGYHVAFAACAVLAFLGIVVYAVTYKPFFGNIGIEPDDPLPDDKKRSFITKMIIVLVICAVVLATLFATGTLSISVFSNVISTVSIIIPIVYLVVIYKSKKTEPHEKKKILCLVPPFICNAVTLLIWTQTISILAIFYEEKVNRVLFGIEVPAASMQTIPAVFAVIIGSILTAVWTKLGKKQPYGTTKMGIGTIFYAILMLGEGFTCPIGYSITAVAAPKAFMTQMMTIWSMSQSTGAALNTLLTNFYKEGSEIPFFVAIGVGVCAVGAVVAIFSKKLAVGMGLDKNAEA